MRPVNNGLSSILNKKGDGLLTVAHGKNRA
jgi:hypothetical protein